MTQIIDEKALLEDSMEILTEHYELSEPEAKHILNEHIMGKIVDRMYSAQESHIEDLYLIFNRKVRDDKGSL